MKSTLEIMLARLLAQQENVQGVAVVKANGKQVITVLPDNLNEQENMAISAILLSLSKKVSQNLIHDQIENILVCYDQGYGILSRCDYDTVLLTLTKVKGVEKVPFSAIKKVSKKIARQM